MNKTLSEARAYAKAVAAQPRPTGSINRFVLPPFTVAREVVQQLRGTDIAVGAQNLHWDDAGAWTGEISGRMLADCGLTLVEIGHSERRQHFGDTNERVTQKVAAACRWGLLPLVCVGETASERDAGQVEAVLIRQLDAAIDGLPRSSTPDETTPPLLIAYEPVWAIGEAGRPADPVMVGQLHHLLADHLFARTGSLVPCLYGGGVSLPNAAAYLDQDAVDGLFVGRAAWSAEGFIALTVMMSAAWERCAVEELKV